MLERLDPILNARRTSAVAVVFYAASTFVGPFPRSITVSAVPIALGEGLFVLASLWASFALGLRLLPARRRRSGFGSL